MCFCHGQLTDRRARGRARKMSWRAESTFKANSSAFAEDEKEWLKAAKKLRDIAKLEAKQKAGDKLEPNQLDKVNAKDDLLKQIEDLSRRLPSDTKLLENNKDIVDLLPRGKVEGILRKRQQDHERRVQRDAKEREEREKPVWMACHERPILGVAISEDNRIFTCSKDKTIICWSMKEQLLKSICTLGGHNGAVWALDLAPPAFQQLPGRLISGAADGKVLLWQTDPAYCKQGTVLSAYSTLQESGCIVRVLQWCPFDAEEEFPRFASASERPLALGVCQLRPKGKGWEAKQIMTKSLPEKTPGRANDLKWVGGAIKKLITAHDSGYVGIWKAEGEGDLLKTLKLHSSPVIKLCLTTDGGALLTASHDGTAACIDVSKPACEVLTTYKMEHPLNVVATSLDYKATADGIMGTVIVAGGRHNREVTTTTGTEDEFFAKILDGQNGEWMESGKGHFGPVHALVVMPDYGKYGAFATGSEDGTIRVHGVDGSTLHSSIPL